MAPTFPRVSLSLHFPSATQPSCAIEFLLEDKDLTFKEEAV
jgi:hypothetical protein